MLSCEAIEAIEGSSSRYGEEIHEAQFHSVSFTLSPSTTSNNEHHGWRADMKEKVKS